MELTGQIRKIIELALEEDILSGDITTGSLKPALTEAVFAFEAGEEFVLAGTEVVRAVFHSLDGALEVSFKYEDGEKIKKGLRFGTVAGNAAAILTGERVALNFLQHMSAVATNTARLTRALSGKRMGLENSKSIKLLDTRKTTPGLRALEKYAVRVGGGVNDRAGLYDAAVLKVSHIAAAGGIEAAVSLIRPRIPVSAKIGVEVLSVEEAREALLCGADLILFDASRMEIEKIVEACRYIKDGARTVLAGLTPERAVALAKLPVDYISMGAVTQNIKAAEISLVFIQD